MKNFGLQAENAMANTSFTEGGDGVLEKDRSISAALSLTWKQQ